MNHPQPGSRQLDFAARKARLLLRLLDIIAGPSRKSRKSGNAGAARGRNHLFTVGVRNCVPEMKRHREQRRRLIGGWLSVAAGVFLLSCRGEHPTINSGGSALRQSLPGQFLDSGCGAILNFLVDTSRNLFYARLLGRTHPSFCSIPSHSALGLLEASVAAASSTLYIIDRELSRFTSMPCLDER